MLVLYDDLAEIRSWIVAGNCSVDREILISAMKIQATPESLRLVHCVEALTDLELKDLIRMAKHARR